MEAGGAVPPGRQVSLYVEAGPFDPVGMLPLGNQNNENERVWLEVVPRQLIIQALSLLRFPSVNAVSLC